MQILVETSKKLQEFATENSTTILTAAGVVGTVATAVLAGRAGIKAADIIREEELKHIHPEGTTDAIDSDTMGLSRGKKIMLAGPQFIPAVVTGGVTVGCIIMSHRMSAQKAAALAAAYGIVQRDFSEYKDKVNEKLTGAKKEQVKDELAQDRVNNSTGYEKIVVIDGNEVLCYDEPNDRYFRGTMEKINRAVNSVNAEIMNHGSAPSSHFYDELELKAPTWTENLGWNMDNMCDVEISMTNTPDNRPCIAFKFTHFPIEDWQKTNY